MIRHGCWLSVMGMFWLLTGCTTLPEWAQPKDSLRVGTIAPLIPEIARSQFPDGTGVKLKKPIGPPPGIAPPPGVAPPPGIAPASMTSRGPMRVAVRVWVNGKPIFEEEVMQVAGPDLARAVRTLSEPQRSDKIAEIMNASIEGIVDQELMYQDAVKKLEKFSPRSLDKLKDFVNAEFQKSLERMRQANLPEDQIRELEPVARRMMERSMISQEYARSRIKPIMESRIGLSEIRDYYEAHKKEFITEDRIVWQDIFIPLSPKHPTIESLKRFAEDLIAGVRTADDFNKLMAYNEGDSKLRGGEGLGHKRGEIRPVELEEHLLQMETGEIGPVVAFATGVHVFRIAKKERSQLLPLNDETQKIIRKKLENEVADREYRRLVRELRQRAVIQIERDMP